MRLLRLTTILVVAAMAAIPANAAELTADDVVDRMLAAHSAWLKADVDSLSYVLKRHWNDCQTIRVSYRSPRHLRVEWQPSNAFLLLPNGRGFACEWNVWPEDWDADRVLDTAIDGLVLRWGAWALANHRDKCRVSNLREERVDGRDAYCVTIEGYIPPDFGLAVPAPPLRRDDIQHLWVDAATFRPLRAAYDKGRVPAGEPSHAVIRYADYQPFPAGGEAPMRLEEWDWWPKDQPFNADPPREPDEIDHYHVVDGKLWLRRSATDGNGKVREEVRELSTSRVSITAFYDKKLLWRLETGATTYQCIEGYLTGQQWQELHDACERIISLGVGDAQAKSIAFYLYFWHGDYQKAIDVREPGGGNIYQAWAYDAIGEREKAVEIYRRIANARGGRASREAEQGLKRPWLPLGKRLEPARNERLLEPAPTWQAKANVAGLTPEAAIDANRRTRWVSVQPQHPDMWFQVDLGAPTDLRRIAFDFVGDLTVYYNDYPREYRVEVSVDGQHWERLAEGPGLLDNLLNLPFEPRKVRHVRIHQTSAARQNCWSIHEIFFYAPK